MQATILNRVIRWVSYSADFMQDGVFFQFTRAFVRESAENNESRSQGSWRDRLALLDDFRLKLALHHPGGAWVSLDFLLN
ncbi:MAG TPA: hypothetical protein DIW81_06750 [Planctomycetaceae bacterium]|nr:hypothetical protein [Rubinisphaera sp.]HCS51279.1 hypothetical protein [Planctomycetaceae bacterium]